MKIFAQFVSFLFHPILFLLLIPFLAVYKQTHSGVYAIKWGIFTALAMISLLSVAWIVPLVAWARQLPL